MNKNYPILVLLAVVIAAGAFFGGTLYQKSKTPAIASRINGQGQTRTGQGTRGGFGGQTTGDISSVDDKSITVKMPDGSSRIVFLSASTTINKSAEATKTDLVVGQRVAVFGSANTDGSVTAQSINLNPIARPSISPTPTTGK